MRRLARLVNGGTPTADQANWGGAIRWATPVDLGKVDGGYLNGTDRTLTAQGLQTGSAAVPAGSILISSRAPIGYVAITEAETAFNQGCKGLVPLDGVDARYLRYWLTARRTDLQAAGSGSTFMELSAEALMRVEIPGRSKSEQQRIADFLDDQVARIDHVNAARRLQSQLLQDSVASGIHAAVTGADQPNREPSRLAWAKSLPANWPSVRLALVARIGTGHTPSRSHPEYWRDCDIPWLTTTDVYKFRYQQVDSLDRTEVMISPLGLANSSAVVHPAGTVALSRTSGSAGFAILMGCSMATSQDFATWTPGPRLRSEYLLWCLRAMHRDLMGRLAMGSTHLTIYFPDLLSIRVPLPPLESQADAIGAIRSLMSSGRSMSAAMEQSIIRLDELKRSLITAAVMGEFDVSSADGSRVPMA